MKKKLLIVFGIVLILAAAGIWAYLFFATPSLQEFADFNFGGSREDVRPAPEPTVDTSPVDENGAPQRLKQLTTKPVAGATILDGTVRYVERGTGHVYEIDIASGEETQLSITTVERVTRAIFSPNGNRIAFISDNGYVQDVLAGTITKNDDGAGVIDGVELPEGAYEVGFTNTGESVQYLTETPLGAEGVALDLTSDTRTSLFTIPLRDVRMVWGETNYAYTKPSAETTGYLYRITGGDLERASSDGNGLMAFTHQGTVITSVFEGGAIVSRISTEANGRRVGISLFPEKCTRGSETNLYCAGMTTLPGGTYPDDWYKGVVSMNDMLWQVDPETGEAVLLVSLFDESRRQIDVSYITTDENDERIAFINKNDGTLWMYDMTI